VYFLVYPQKGYWNQLFQYILFLSCMTSRYHIKHDYTDISQCKTIPIQYSSHVTFLNDSAPIHVVQKSRENKQRHWKFLLGPTYETFYPLASSPIIFKVSSVLRYVPQCLRHVLYQFEDRISGACSMHKREMCSKFWSDIMTEATIWEKEEYTNIQ
jgi:hypothetical protein